MSRRSDEPEDAGLFADLPRRRRRALSRGAVRVKVAAGDVLFEENSEGHEFVAILDGEVEVRRDGERVTVLGKGEYLGEAALLSRKHRNASAVALTDGEILCIGQKDFEVLKRASPRFARDIDVLDASRRTAP